MPLNHNDLFHESDPRELLDYLGKRLAARDLSSEEALAMLGSLHEALSAQKIDPQTYLKYSEFMENLRQQMPQVYNFVADSWNKRGGSDRTTGDEGLAEADQTEKAEEGASSSKIESQSRLDDSVAEAHEELEGGEAEDESEGGERDEQPETDEKGGPQDEDQEDSEEELESQKEARQEESEEGDEGESKENESEREDESEEPEQEVNEEQRENENDKEAERGEEGADADAGEESDGLEEDGGDEGEAEPTERGGEGGQEESEWPEMEEPGPEEPIEGEEGNMPAID